MLVKYKIALILLFATIINNVICNSIDYDFNGYIVYCPCMGRFGNQADHFLGSLAFAKALNRTLILPPWVEYRYGEVKSIQVPFETYFNVQTLSTFHKVITMDTFMNDISSIIWPPEKRYAFCYTHRIGEIENSCNAKSGNPFGPFWDTFDIEFNGSVFYGPLNYDAQNSQMIDQWKKKYNSDQWPVLAFTGAPASFPVQKENLHLHKYMKWSNQINVKAKTFVKKNMNGGGFLGIHLRNGQDWVKACQHVKDSPKLFSTPQCLGYGSEKGTLTLSMCLPQKADIIKQVKRVLKKFNDVKYLFVASDSNHMVDEFKNALLSLKITIVTQQLSNPHMDLAILGEANYFIGNCVSSFTAFVKRARDVTGLPSEFWSFPNRKKPRHEEL